MVGTQNHREQRYARRNTMAIGSDHVIITGSERPARSDAKLVGPADASERVMVSVEVRQRPDAPPPADLAKVAEFAQEYGLTVEGSFADRRTVQLSGSVEQMNKAFGVQLNNYEFPGGTYRSRE